VYNVRRRAGRTVRQGDSSEEDTVKQTYRVISGLIALGVLVQAGAIAAGWFTAIHDVDNGLVIDKNYDGNAFHGIHGFVGFNVMPLLGLALLIVSFFAYKSVPGARKWGGIVLGLIVLQVALALFAFSIPALGALHGINALAVFGTAVRASMLTRESTTARSSVPGAFDVPRQSTGSSAPEASRPVN
jgi:heme A synthase